MRKKDLIINDKSLLFLFSLIILNFFFSIYFLSHIYDGHHQGLMFSNAIDILKGKKPYSEIYIQYGLLTTIIHAVTLKIFGIKVFFLNILTIVLYLFSIFLIYKITYKITNGKYALISSISLLFCHPLVWLPWANYIAFFFIVLSLFFLINKKNFFIFGLSLSLSALSRQEFLLPIVISLFLTYLCFIKIRINNLQILKGFFAPFLIFFVYLLFSGTFLDWLKTLNLINLYLSEKELTITNYVINYIIFFLKDSFFNFINYPQYTLISIILISNTILSIYFFYTKNINLFFISILSIFLSIVAINLEIFRLYTSVSIGIITLCYFLYKSHFFLNSILLLTIIFISSFSIIFYPTGNNDIFKISNLYNNYVLPKQPKLKLMKIEPYRAKYLNNLDFINNEIKKKCNITYLENLTFDSFLNNIFDYDRVKLHPYINSNTKDLSLTTYFDVNFVKKINKEIKNKNILLLVTEDNLKYSIGNIFITSDYNYSEVNINNFFEKPKILKFYYPKKCFK